MVWDNAAKTLYGTTANAGRSPSVINDGQCYRPDGAILSGYGCGVAFSFTP